MDEISLNNTFKLNGENKTLSGYHIIKKIQKNSLATLIIYDLGLNDKGYVVLSLSVFLVGCKSAHKW